MVLLFIRVIFVVLLLSVMVSLLIIFPPTVFVASPTPFNMLSVAFMELSQVPTILHNDIRDLKSKLMS